MENTNPSQMQNPNMVPSPMVPGPISSGVVGKKSHWALIVIILILLVGFFVAWMYVNQMDFGYRPIETPTQAQLDQAEDAKIRGDIESTDLGDLDAEFQAIDQDANSL